MSKKDEALKLALEALETIRQPLRINTSLDAYDVGRAITAINEALAEQPALMIRGDIRDGLVDDEPAQQEPVATVTAFGKSAGSGPKLEWLTGASVAVGDRLYTSPQPAQQQNEADELIRNLGFDPEQFRTEAGFINHMKLRAAIKHPEEYQAAMQPMYQKLTNCVLCGRLNPKEGMCDHGVEQPAQQEPVAWIDMSQWPPIRWRDGMLRKDVDQFDGQGLYTSPQPAQPSKPWVGLTIKEIEWCFEDANGDKIVAARNIEDKLREKNAAQQEPLTDEQVAYILGQLPKPPTNDGSALHDWAVQAVRELAAHGIKGDA